MMLVIIQLLEYNRALRTVHNKRSKINKRVEARVEVRRRNMCFANRIIKIPSDFHRSLFQWNESTEASTLFKIENIFVVVAPQGAAHSVAWDDVILWQIIPLSVVAVSVFRNLFPRDILPFVAMLLR